MGIIKKWGLNVESPNKKETPQHTHDCTQCVFLGRHHRYDLYYHNAHKHRTVIARFGNGADYTSGLEFAIPIGSEPLYQAKLMAIKRGLIKE